MSPRVRVYLACSLDGFIAATDNGLDWLAPPADAPPPVGPSGGLDFPTFMSEVGCMLMGRTTYDVVAGMDMAWPYGPCPVLVATSRPLEPAAPTVWAVSGDVRELVAEALEAAQGGDVYLDGGGLVRAALSAGLVDELVLTLVPIALGAGVSLFQGLEERQRFTFGTPVTFAGSMVQVVAVPVKAASAGDTE